MNKKIILTGDRPTGPLHIGHYIGSLENRIKLQNEYNQFIMIADMQALTDNFENVEKVRSNVLEVMIDYLSVGIDPSKTTIFLQSQIPEISELTMLYLNLVTVQRLERNPTVKNEIHQKGFDGIPAGFLCYPVNQSADISIFLADKVPVGEDQLPMIEQTNEIVRKFNRIYNTSFLRETEALLSNENSRRLVGIDGKAKMSKSLNNAIFLKDSDEEITKKIKMCYTDPNHLKVTDPGNVESNVVFNYLDAFNPDTDENESLKTHYKKGGLGDSILKKRLTEVMINFIKPIREKRQYYENNLHEVKDILKKGTLKAGEVARINFQQIKSIVGIDYEEIFKL
jgi:tryptophanyl-tRNA synthetase